MWANISVGVLGVLVAGVVVTAGVVYGDEIGKSSFFSSMVDGLQNLAMVSELEISLDKEPTDVLEEKEKDYTPYAVFATSDKDITFGVKYGKLLVGVENDDWWNKNIDSRKKLVDEDKSTIFKGIKNGSNSASVAKSKCEEAYKKKELEIAVEDIGNIWILCSPIKSRPLPVHTARSKYQGKLASEEKYSPYFLEDRPKNKYAWEMLYEKFVKESNDEKSDEFKKVNKGYSKEDNSSLNKVCLSAYSDEASVLDKNDKDKYKQNVLKFWTFTNLDLQGNNK